MLYAIAVYGALLILVSLWMIASPRSWVDKAVTYCGKPYMHPIEIAICLSFGLSFMLAADDAIHPPLFRGFGYVLTGVGVVLMFVPPTLHQRYGVWSIQKMGGLFRPLGFGSLAFGIALAYLAIASIP